ncbi:MAG: hypothetical protein ACOCXH_02475 [Cyclobacteriaceae bacterium]
MGCVDNESVSPTEDYTVSLVGEYSGLYSNNSNTNEDPLIKFTVTRIENDLLQIEPEDNAVHPAFEAKLFPTTTGNIGFEILNQTISSIDLSGAIIEESEFSDGFNRQP